MLGTQRMRSLVFSAWLLILSSLAVLFETGVPLTVCLAEQPLATSALEEYIQAALEAEADGDFLLRQQMLANARACQPDAPQPRWHSGYVQDAEGEWLEIEQCIERFAEQAPALEAYEQLRSAAVDDLASHLRLAVWCRQHGLLPQARAHFERVIDLDSDHWGARQALGYQLLAGEWVGPEIIGRFDRETQATAAAVKRYGKQLRQIAQGLRSSKPADAMQARQQLFQLDDPACILAAQSLLSTSEPELASLVVEWMGGFDDVCSSEALLQYAVLYPDENVRQQAAELLSQRPLYDFVPKLLQSLSSPIMVAAVPVFNADGTLAGYRQGFAKQTQERHELFVINTDIQRLAVPLLIGAPSGPEADGNWVMLPPSGLPENRSVERQLRQWTSVEVARRQDLVQQQNWVNDSLNERAAELLSVVAGQEIASEASAMWQWWDEFNEVEYQKYKPGRYREQSVRREIPLYVGVGYDESPLAFTASGRSFGPWRAGGECFVAGTPVLTTKGLRAIESIRAGDLVFARHTPTGALLIKPVLRATERPRAATIQIDVDGELLQCTRGHLFWVAGTGWKKASELRKGDVLHAAKQPALVSDVSPAEPLVTYNLEVADCNTYFVGKSALLSHDVTPRRTRDQEVPGLAAITLGK